MIHLNSNFNLDIPLLFTHTLQNEKLFSLNKISELVEILPKNMIEPVYKKQITHNSHIRDVVLNIKSNSSYIFLRNIEQVPAYNTIMQKLISELVDNKIMKRENILKPMCFMFISSPKIVAPFHIDPEHNFLFQIKGKKKFYLNNRMSKKIISDREITDFYKDEVHYKLAYKNEYNEELTEYQITPNKGIYVPVTYPHWVQNGLDYSISFSFTFRTPSSEKHRIKYLNL